MLQHHKHKQTSFKKENEDIKNQIEVLELWNIISEIKNPLDVVNKRMRKKKISELKVRIICITEYILQEANTRVAQWLRLHLPSRRHGFHPWVGKISRRRARQDFPGFLPGKSHGQRSLVGYSPWGCRVRHDLATKQQQICKKERNGQKRCRSTEACVNMCYGSSGWGWGQWQAWKRSLIVK